MQMEQNSAPRAIRSFGSWLCNFLDIIPEIIERGVLQDCAIDDQFYVFPACEQISSDFSCRRALVVILE